MALYGFSPAIKINKAETKSASVKFTNGTIKFETHQGTLDLSTTELTMLLLPLTDLAHDL